MKLPKFLTSFLFQRIVATVALKREPDVFIGGTLDPYMLRWHVIPRNRFFNVYLHHILRDDDDRALHDHPFRSVSLILQGAYWEIMPAFHWDPLGPHITVHREAGDVVYRSAEQPHRLALPTLSHQDDTRRTAWSLFITGPRVREWGFWCKNGWKHWKEFVNPARPGEVGAGCGETNAS